jgi:hypothetical protein
VRWGIEPLPVRLHPRALPPSPMRLCRELEFLPCLTKVDDVDAISAALEGVTLHLEVAVLGAQVDVGRKHHLYVLLLLGQRLRSASAYHHCHGEGEASVVACGVASRSQRRGAASAVSGSDYLNKATLSRPSRRPRVRDEGSNPSQGGLIK